MKVCIYIDNSILDQQYQTIIKMLKVDLLLAKHEPLFVDFAQMDMATFNDDAENIAQAYIITPCGMNGTAKFYQHINMRDVGNHQKPIIVYNFNGELDKMIWGMSEWTSSRMAKKSEIQNWYKVAIKADDILKALE